MIEGPLIDRSARRRNPRNRTELLPPDGGRTIWRPAV